MVTNTNVTATEIRPIGGGNNAGWKLGFIDSAAKAAQNDTWTVTNAKEVIWGIVTKDSDGVADAITISTNVITLTVNQTDAHSGLIIYR
jgi:hypothetical protein